MFTIRTSATLEPKEGLEPPPRCVQNSSSSQLSYFGMAGAGDDPATLGYEPNEIPISTTPRCKDMYYFCDSIHEIRINNVNNESTLYVMRNRGIKRENRV